MTSAGKSRRLRQGDYHLVPELENGQGHRRTPSRTRSQERYSDAGPATADRHQRVRRQGSYRDRELPEKPLPALPSIPMPTALQPGYDTGMASRRRRPLMLFLCAVGGCLLAGLVLELAWHGVRTPRSRQVWECFTDADGHVPQYFQTSPELWAGPTATGKAPFMAQTRVVPTGTYVPNQPLQTQVPIEGMTSQNESIFNMMGYLSPYQPSPGFGVEEYGIPDGAEIVQVQMLSRHGSRYPTLGSDTTRFGQKVKAAEGKLKAKGALHFLNDWSYELGHEILVPKGRSELFESGVLHSYMYSQLYNSKSKLIVRTTTQDRMLKSAEYFLAGFFGLEWTNNATIEVIIEEAGFNNSLAGYMNCPEARSHSTGTQASLEWQSHYLQNATERLQGMVTGFDWSINDTYAAQTMCPYETIAYGYSRWCDLFTYEEWVGFEYAIDLAFAGNNMFQNPTSRAVGIGYQQEVMARLKNHTLGYSGSQINVTLDSNEETFPLNQSLYFDFSHDTNIASILTAFGIRQFAEVLPADRYPGPHNLTVSHITPFGARLDMEIIRTPKPLKPDRSGYEDMGGETRYMHFVLNQRTLPLGVSFSECDVSRRDGWCELTTFIKVQEEMEKLADYDHACHTTTPASPYGMVTDGRPVKGAKNDKGGI